MLSAGWRVLRKEREQWQTGAERGDRYQPLKPILEALGEMKTVPVGIAGT